ASRVRSRVERGCPQRPAPCDVVACATSGARSINRMSFWPARARLYATPHPIAPPPTMTISASVTDCMVSALQLIQIPTDKCVYVVFFVFRVRAGNVCAGINSPLLAFTNNPILLRGKLPKRQKFPQFVITAFHRIFIDKPPHTDCRPFRAGGQ